jgi:hypothetical protein
MKSETSVNNSIYFSLFFPATDVKVIKKFMEYLRASSYFLKVRANLGLLKVKRFLLGAPWKWQWNSKYLMTLSVYGYLHNLATRSNRPDTDEYKWWLQLEFKKEIPFFDYFIFVLFPHTHDACEEFADINDVKLQFIKMRFYYLTLWLNVANLKVSCRVIDKFLFASSYYHLFFLQERMSENHCAENRYKIGWRRVRRMQSCKNIVVEVTLKILLHKMNRLIALTLVSFELFPKLFLTEISSGFGDFPTVD